MYLRKVWLTNRNASVSIPMVLAREYGIRAGQFVLMKAVKEGILIQKVVEVGNEARITPIRYDPRTKA